MDNSETYIKMCDCRDVQELKYKYASDNSFWHSMPNEWWGTDEYGGDIWLPRQDQLQDMVLEGGRDLSSMFQEFIHLVYEIRYRESDPAIKFFTSMEQLWLAFVMKEKYNKVWNGEEWLKQ